MIKIVKKTDDAYPLRLKRLNQMPEILYVRGNLPADDKPSVAIVGARSCSNYGRNMASEFARVLSQEGVQIISGLALGVDGEAHAGAMKGKTPTYAVLANDVNVCYPRANQRIYDKILESGGGILGEQPEGTQARPYFFPARNRIISALSDVIVVVEARRHSGSLITVDYALEQGKTVYALPGRVGDVLSEGCNRLIAQGAGIACSPDMILQELGMEKSILAENFRQRKVLQMSAEAQYIYRQLDTTPISLEDLCRRVPYDIQQVQGALLELQLEQIVIEISKNYYVKSSKFS
ncbi:MAG: DNA-processing protein DprA [Eubacteriales bacterium]|nr:DNA-processing protein DprA [Eubacteriales bacterium]